MPRYHSIVRSAGTALACVLLVLTMGCSSTEYYGEWQEPRPILIPFSKILIVVDTPYSELKRELEEQLYEGATEGGTLATTSTRLDNGAAGTSEEALVLMLEESFADSLLLIRFLHPEDDSTRIDIAPADDLAQQQPKLPPLPGQSAIVDATVYDISDSGRPVYVIDIETTFRDKGADTIERAAADISSAIIGELMNAKIIDD